MRIGIQKGLRSGVGGADRGGGGDGGVRRLQRFARAQRFGAFTLIELLVAIAIIAVLIGLLLPALRHARDAGRSSICLSRERQIHLAMTLYAGENRGFIAREGSAGDTPRNYRERISWSVAYRPQLDTTVAPNVDPNDMFERAPYFRCPSRPLDAHNVHYAVNGFAFFADGTVDERGEGPGHIPLRRGPMQEDRIPSPSTMMYLTEFAKDPGGLMRLSWGSFAKDDISLGQVYDIWLPHHVQAGVRPDDYRLNPNQHGLGSNSLFLDGHAIHMSKDKLENLETWKDGVLAR